MMNRGWVYLAGAGILAYVAKNIILGKQLKKVSQAQKQAFINEVAKMAPEIQVQFNIAPAIFMAQAALESDFGTSQLARQGKNLFGIKVSKAWEKDGKPVWRGDTEEYVKGLPTTVKKERFKQYASWKESAYDWATLISGTYKTAFKFAVAGDIKGYGDAIFRTGYSTHPKYAQLLQTVAAQIA